MLTCTLPLLLECLPEPIIKIFQPFQDQKVSYLASTLQCTLSLSARWTFRDPRDERSLVEHKHTLCNELSLWSNISLQSKRVLSNTRTHCATHSLQNHARRNKSCRSDGQVIVQSIVEGLQINRYFVPALRRIAETKTFYCSSIILLLSAFPLLVRNSAAFFHYS